MLVSCNIYLAEEMICSEESSGWEGAATSYYGSVIAFGLWPSEANGKLTNSDCRLEINCFSDTQGWQNKLGDKISHLLPKGDLRHNSNPRGDCKREIYSPFWGEVGQRRVALRSADDDEGDRASPLPSILGHSSRSEKIPTAGFLCKRSIKLKGKSIVE